MKRQVLVNMGSEDTMRIYKHRSLSLSIYMSMCHICIYLYTFCIYIYYIYLFIYIYIGIYIYMYIYINTYLYICIQIYTPSIRIYIYIFTYLEQQKYVYIYGIYVRLPCFVQSQVLEEAQRLQSLHGVTEPKRPFGLGSTHSLANSSGMLRKRILKVAEIAGFDDAQDVLAKLEPALPPSDRELKKESQLAIQDGQVEEPNQTMVVDSTTTDTGTARTTYSREKNDSALIADICQVVEYGLSLPPGSARQKLVRLKYPNLMKSNVYSKWVARYFKYKLWLFPEELAKTTRAIPNLDMCKSASRHGQAT